MLERLLRKVVPFKEIGWTAIEEKFTRYTLVKTRWFNLYLHQLSAPNPGVTCHDHPWWFVTLLLRGGYLEEVEGVAHRRRPGMILYRPAKFRHDVTTPYGESWSLVITGPKERAWSFQECHTSKEI